MAIKERPAKTILLFLIMMIACLQLAVSPAFGGEKEDPDREMWMDMKEEKREFQRETLSEMKEEAAELFNKDVEAFLKKELPGATAHLEQFRARAKSPTASWQQKLRYYEAQIFLAEIAEELYDAKEDMPKVYGKLREAKTLEIQAEVLADRYRASRVGEERKNLKKEIRKLLENAFKISQEIREMEAKQIEEELKEISSMLHKRWENRDFIIDRRLHELIDDEDPYEW